MSRFLLTTALVAFCLGGPALSKTSTISSVDVSIDLTAVTNKAAALRYTRFSDDLKNAITALLVDRLADDGDKVGVHISEVELSNSYSETIGTSNTRLVGVVTVAHLKNNSIFDTYTLTVDINQAATFLPVDLDKTKLKASSDEYYHAMIQAFAKGVVERLDR